MTEKGDRRRRRRALAHVVVDEAAHRRDYGFQPIVVFDGEGRFVTALLRPGKRPGGQEIRAFLRRLVGATSSRPGSGWGSPAASRSVLVRANGISEPSPSHNSQGCDRRSSCARGIFPTGLP